MNDEYSKYCDKKEQHNHKGDDCQCWLCNCRDCQSLTTAVNSLFKFVYENRRTAHA